MAFADKIRIGEELAVEVIEKAAKELTALQVEYARLRDLCLTNGYCPSCATKAREGVDVQGGAYFEQCQTCGTDFVVKVEGVNT